MVYKPGIATKSNGEVINIAGDDIIVPVVGGDTAVPALQNPYGYYETFEFIGWRDENGNIYKENDQIVRLTRQDGGKATLTAVWEEITYSVVLQAGYTSTNMRIENIKYSQEFTVPEAPYERPGYYISTYSLIRVERSLNNPMIVENNEKKLSSYEPVEEQWRTTCAIKFDEPKLPDTERPRLDIKPTYVFGYRAKDAHNNVKYIDVFAY